MAGPCCHIITAENDIDKVLNILESVVNVVSRNEKPDQFWVINTSPISGQYKGDGRPFIADIEILDATDDDWNQSEIEQMASKLNAQPVLIVYFCAMCNNIIDHHILSELIICVCDQIKGLIVFDGLIDALLPRGMQTKSHSRAVKYSAESLADLNGLLVPIYYDLNELDSGARHLADSTFLASWSRHPKFRLPK